jgi:hypothetical protein
MGQVPSEWVDDIQGLRCPKCREVLLSLAARFEPMGRPDPLHVHSGTRMCRNGHALPPEDELLAAQADLDSPK